jgi:hypothetical protein
MNGTGSCLGKTIGAGPRVDSETKNDNDNDNTNDTDNNQKVNDTNNITVNIQNSSSKPNGAREIDLSAVEDSLSEILVSQKKRIKTIDNIDANVETVVELLRDIQKKQNRIIYSRTDTPSELKESIREMAFMQSIQNELLKRVLFHEGSVALPAPATTNDVTVSRKPTGLGRIRAMLFKKNTGTPVPSPAPSPVPTEIIKKDMLIPSTSLFENKQFPHLRKQT